MEKQESKVKTHAQRMRWARAIKNAPVDGRGDVADIHYDFLENGTHEEWDIVVALSKLI